MKLPALLHIQLVYRPFMEPQPEYEWIWGLMIRKVIKMNGITLQLLNVELIKTYILSSFIIIESILFLVVLLENASINTFILIWTNNLKVPAHVKSAHKKYHLTPDSEFLPSNYIAIEAIWHWPGTSQTIVWNSANNILCINQTWKTPQQGVFAETVALLLWCKIVPLKARDAARD